METILSKLLADKQMPVDKEWALDMLDEHPAFVLLAAMLLARNVEDLDADTRQRLQAAVALGASDRQAWCDYADFAGCDWSKFYPAPQAPKEKTTEDAIETFINTYGKQSEKEEALLERLIFNPVPPDYLQGVKEAYDPADPLALPPELDPAAKEKSEEAPATKEKEVPAPQEKKEAAPAPPPFHGVKKKAPEQAPAAEKPQKPQRQPKAPKQQPGNHLFMESLAKIFIKQQRYERALEIISTLSLNYPEKSAYFADQIRFLQKLIIIQRRQASKSE